MLLKFIYLLLIIIFIALFVLIKRTDKRWLHINDYLGMVTNTVNSIRYGNLSTKIEKLQNPTYQNVTESINRMVETLNDREKMIVEYQTELMRQNRLLESVINSLSDGILIVNEHADILRVTPKISAWFGLEDKKLIGKNLFEYIKTDDNSTLLQMQNSPIIINNLKENNFVISSQKLINDDKKIRYVLLIKDVTNECEIQKLKEDFVTTLTHDLKVPIIAAENIIEFLLNGKFGEINEKQNLALKNMQTSNKELIDLVQILLETYKVNNSGMQLVKEKIELNPFIKNIVEEMQNLTENIIISYDVESNFYVNIDSFQMTRVLKNLISNAISHSITSDKIDIKTKKDDKYVYISIIDYGQGISKDEIDKIFNKYYSVSKKYRKIGTGLGLYLSQQIVKSHGGEISVESEENVKTEFCVKIPV